MCCMRAILRMACNLAILGGIAVIGELTPRTCTFHNFLSLELCLAVMSVIRANDDSSISFYHLGLRTACPDKEWRPQFEAVRPTLAKCLGLKTIRLPDVFDKLGVDKSGEPPSSPEHLQAPEQHLER